MSQHAASTAAHPAHPLCMQLGSHIIAQYLALEMVKLPVT